ncbi:MAG: MarR family transcriptional regulator [Erysipelotrichia bacterium]|nr:MarR family transcriptional regulator [Erysipelotrichia bacterium]
MQNIDLELLHSMNHAGSLYRRLHHQIAESDGRLEGEDFSGYGRLLHTLIKKGDMTQKQLAEALEIRPQSLTSALKKLEEKGFITRTHNQNDRRMQTVHLCEQGKNTGLLLHSMREKTAKIYFSCLNADEKCQLLSLLNKVMESTNVCH